MALDRTLLGNLERMSLVQVLPGLKRLLAEKGEVRWLDEGEVVCEEGERLFRLVIPLNGNLRLTRRDGDAQAFIGYLLKYRSAGLLAILRDEPLPYSVSAEFPTAVITLPVHELLRLLQAEPAYRHYLLLMCSSSGARGLKRFLETQGLGTEAIVDVFGAIAADSVKVAAGAAVELDRPRLLLVDRGVLGVRSSPDARVLRAAEVPEGGWLGGEALVPPGAYSYAVHAESDAELRWAPLADLAPKAEAHGLVEVLVAEPWLGKPEAARADAGGVLTRVPGRPLSVAALGSLGLEVNPNHLQPAYTDAQTVVASLFNVALLCRQPLTSASAGVELQEAGEASFVQVASALERFGFVTSPRKLAFAQLPRAHMPSLVQYGSHMCVLVAVNRRGVVLVDPAQGVLSVSADDFRSLWSGQLLEVMPSRTELEARTDLVKSESESKSGEPTPEGLRVAVRALAGLMRPYRRAAVYCIVIGFAVTGLNMVSPKITQIVFDRVLSLRDMSMLATVLTASALITVGIMVLGLTQGYLATEVAARFDLDLSNEFMRHLFRRQPSDSRRRDVGDGLVRIRELALIRTFLAQLPIQVLMDVVSLIGFTAMLFTYDATIGILGLALLPALFILRYLSRPHLKALHLKAIELSQKTQSAVTEHINAMTTVKAMAAESMMRERYESDFVASLANRRSSAVTSASLESVTGVLTSAVQLGGLALACKLALERQMSVGEVVAINLYLGSLMGPVGSLAGHFSTFEQLRTTVGRVAEMLYAPKEDGPGAARTMFNKRLDGKIKLDRVGFRYGADSPWVLSDVDLTIYPGQIVAVVGRSGCGKTTLAKVLAGLYPPTAGRVFYDDFDATFITRGCVRRQIGVIMQESELFAGTIRENITFGDDAPDDARMAEAARLAYAAPFINAFPAGAGQYLAEGGLGLSGGQKQRVSIARTLYRQPAILVFDEATSALDAESEMGIVDQMREILKGKTALVIAHRLSTIKRADRIVVMDQGRIVEEGTHDSLLRRDGAYCALFHEQLAGAAG